MFPSVEAISISIEIHLHVVALDKNIFMLRIAAKTRLILVGNPIGIQILGAPVLGWPTTNIPVAKRAKHRKDVNLYERVTASSS